MWQALKEVYRESRRFAFALPFLFSVPILAELAQHGIEYHSGTYESFAMAQATEHATGRTVSGNLKELTLFLMGYWVVRFLALEHDPKRIVAMRWRNVWLFGPVVGFEMGLMLLQVAGPEWTAVHFGQRFFVLPILLAWFVLPVALEVYLICWKTGAALGNSRLTIPVSFRMMHGNFWWSFGLTWLAGLPLLTLHYVAAFAAIGRPTWLTIAILVADALLVGYLGTVLIASNYVIARHAAAKEKVDLAGEEWAMPDRLVSAC